MELPKADEPAERGLQKVIFSFSHGNPGEKNLRVLTLTLSHLSEGDDAYGCSFPELLEHLAKAGIRNTLFAVRPIYRHKPRHDPALATKWIRYLALPGPLGLSTAGTFLFARIIGQLRQLQITDRVDLLHAHGALPCGHAAMLVARELNIPYIVSVYGLDDLFTAQTAGHIDKWRRRIAQRVYAESRRVVCGSENVREQVLERMGRRCRTSVVYNGVDPKLFSPAPEPSETATAVMSAGNLRASEGHDLLVRATAALVKEFPSISLEIIGDGQERSRLQTLVMKLGLEGVVRFIGRQPRQQIADAMKRCELFALTSRSMEPMCLHIQAMSCGKAVIGCRGQGIGEIIQHGTNGFLVGEGNEKELTFALGMLLREPQRRRNLGSAARDTVLERLTVEQQAESLRRIYREAIA